MNAQTIPNPANEKNPPAEQPARKRYLVDFYDEFDFEWAHGENRGEDSKL